MTEQKVFQAQFFAYLSILNSPEDVLQKTMEALNLKRGATYKRINGDTALTTVELVKLARLFNVSLDNIFLNEQFISFFPPSGNDEADQHTHFLDYYSYYLQSIMSYEKGQLTYMANELPIFYYFSHKYIFTFLSAVWEHLQTDNPRFIIKEHSDFYLPLERLRNDVAKYYDSSPVTEIWNSNMLSNLYQQIIFAITIRAFEDVQFLNRLINDIEKLIQNLKDVTLKGNKTSEGKGELKIYLNEFGNYSNILLYEAVDFKATFVGFDMPQFLVSQSEQFYQYSLGWINKIKKRSVLISSEGYQYRELFFIKQENDFKQFKERVGKLVSVYYE